MPEYEDRLHRAMAPRMKLSGDSYMSHKMASGEVNGENIAFPTIMPDETGKLKEYGMHEAFQKALRDKDYKSFGKDAGAADAYAQGDYKRGTVADSAHNREEMLSQILRGERYR